MALYLRCELGQKGRPTGLNGDLRDALESWLAASGADGRFAMKNMAAVSASSQARGTITITKIDEENGEADLLIHTHKGDAGRTRLIPPGKLRKRLAVLHSLESGKPSASPNRKDTMTVLTTSRQPEESAPQPKSEATPHTLLHIYELIHFFTLEGPTNSVVRVITFLDDAGITDRDALFESKLRAFERLKVRMRECHITFEIEEADHVTFMTIRDALKKLDFVGKLIDQAKLSRPQLVSAKPSKNGNGTTSDLKRLDLLLPDEQQKSNVVIIREEKSDETIIVERGRKDRLIISRKEEEIARFRRVQGEPDQPAGQASQIESLAIIVDDHLQGANQGGTYGLFLTGQTEPCAVPPQHFLYASDKPETRFMLVRLYYDRTYHWCWLDCISEPRAVEIHLSLTKLTQAKQLVPAAPPPNRFPISMAAAKPAVLAKPSVENGNGSEPNPAVSQVSPVPASKPRTANVTNEAKPSEPKPVTKPSEPVTTSVVAPPAPEPVPASTSEPQTAPVVSEPAPSSPPAEVKPQLIVAVGPVELRIPVVIQAGRRLVHAWLALANSADYERVLSVLPAADIKRA